MRMARLLAATGDALVSQIATALRWLHSKEANSVDLASLAALGVADWVQDSDTYAQIRDRIALDYVAHIK